MKTLFYLILIKQYVQNEIKLSMPLLIFPNSSRQNPILSNKPKPFEHSPAQK